MADQITRRELFKLGLLVAGVTGAAAAGQLFRQPPGVTLPAVPSRSNNGLGLPWAAANQIVAETVTPTFPALAFDVAAARYGAVGDGTTDNTDSFKRAIEDCSSRGGGHVVVPAGDYATGAIRLLSNVNARNGRMLAG
jgi:polygalacturonase